MKPRKSKRKINHIIIGKRYRYICFATLVLIQIIYETKDIDEAEAAPIEKPKLLKSRELREGETVTYTTIDKYSFLDDGPFVK